jgi:hypothetical protein
MTTDKISRANPYLVLLTLSALVCLVGIGAATVVQRVIAAFKG